MSGKSNIAVLGGGPMGLAAALRLLKQGHHVSIFEAGDRLGGMTASFDFDGLRIERFFHFLCATDHDYFDLLVELGIEDKLHWVNTRMGVFHEGKLYNWGEPFALLKFPGLNLIEKIRYALKVLYCKNLKSFDALDHKKATVWLQKWLGARAYKLLWDPLMSLKFYQLQNEVSAAWIAARVQRVAHSRESLFKEKLGYLEGGSDTFLFAMEAAIRQSGGEIHLSAPVERVQVSNNRVTGLRINNADRAFDKVISTIPLPYVAKIIPDLPKDDLQKLEGQRNVGVVTVKLKLERQLTPYFWLNLTDTQYGIPGVIEYSNLNPLEDTIVYVPYYMPQDNIKFSWDVEQFRAETVRCLQAINPAFSESWIKALHISRYFYAQPVCVPGFLSTLPSMKSRIEGFFMADTSYCYPQDRSITESVKLGNQLAEMASGVDKSDLHG
ncbi:MAG TPA: NAD(P)/FAD-dependent oxidoreductase [Pseudomonadales bacterium]|nr:NAD(P)/FAD-dependent oxidoreductase [Pseudomonadales bacterium]